MSQNSTKDRQYFITGELQIVANVTDGQLTINTIINSGNSYVTLNFII